MLWLIRRHPGAVKWVFWLVVALVPLYYLLARLTHDFGL